MSAASFVRLALALEMPDLPLAVPRGYLPLSGAAWGACSLVAAGALYLGRRWAPAYTRWSAVALAAWYWADRLLFVHTDYARQSWPAAAAITASVLGLVFWSLSRRAVGDFFREGDR